MTRKLIDKVHDRARARAMEEISATYPELWQYLLDQRVTQYRQPDHPVNIRYGDDPSRVYDAARRHAKQDLKEQRPGAWLILIWAWTDHFKAELGWVEEPRSDGAVRGQGGRFAAAR